MKNKLTQLLAAGVVVAGLLVGAVPALASVDTWHIDTDRGGVSNVPYNIDDPATGENHTMIWDVSSGYQQWFAPARYQTEFLDRYYDYVHATALAAATSTLNSSMSSLQSQITALSGSSGLTLSGIQTFMSNQATTSQLVATSTFNGFMSSDDRVKMDSMSPISTSTPSVSYSNRSLNSCFQVSTSKDAFVAYSVDVDTAISLGGGANGQVALRTYSDSGCTTDGHTIQQGKAGLTGTVVIGLAVNNPSSVSLGGVITRGRYAKLETTNLTGTPTYTVQATQEVTGNLTQ